MAGSEYRALLETTPFGLISLEKSGMPQDMLRRKNDLFRDYS